MFDDENPEDIFIVRTIKKLIKNMMQKMWTLKLLRVIEELQILNYYKIKI